MRKVLTLLICLAVVFPVWAADLPVEARIEQAMLGDHRSEENRARNRYRHPVGALTFFGLAEGMTVMEIWPGGGWYTEILAPVIRHHGQFVVAAYDVDVPDQPQYRYRLQKAMLEKFAARPDLYDQVAVVPYSPPASASLGEADSIDMILTFRNTHGRIGDGLAESVFAEFGRVLKPGGVLGVVQHRAAEGADSGSSVEMGYVSEQAVIELARSGGLGTPTRPSVKVTGWRSGFENPCSRFGLCKAGRSLPVLCPLQVFAGLEPLPFQRFDVRFYVGLVLYQAG